MQHIYFLHCATSLNVPISLPSMLRSHLILIIWKVNCRIRFFHSKLQKQAQT